MITNATYDLDQRLTTLRVTNGAALVSGYAYAYADGMNITGITDQLTAANSNTLSYSPANRLAAASGAWGNTTYAYDLVGNRTSEVTTLGATTTTRTSTYPTTSNRLSSIAQTGSATAFRTFTYDAAGNTLTDARAGMTAPLAYTYNNRNRHSALSGGSPARTATYIYNPLQQMISRVTNAAGAPTTIIHYIYDTDGHLILEANGSSAGATVTSLREYIWLPSNDNPANDTMAEEMIGANDNAAPDLPLAAIDVAATPAISMVHTDHLGRPVRMTNSAKATTWSAVWTPWGTAHSVTGTTTITNNQNLRFPGQFFLIETGLAYNWHRTYDPATGRYTQPDPLRFLDGPSVYAYAGSSPFMNVDRNGLETGVIIWDPVGWGSSSFGHTSVHVNQTSYSFGPGGMNVSKLSKYLDANSFRYGKLYGLPLSTVQELRFEACLKVEQGEYSALRNNCVDPIKNCLNKVGFEIVGPTLTPEDLEVVIRSRATSVHTLPQSTLSNGSSAPWTVIK